MALPIGTVPASENLWPELYSSTAMSDQQLLKQVFKQEHLNSFLQQLKSYSGLAIEIMDADGVSVWIQEAVTGWLEEPVTRTTMPIMYASRNIGSVTISGTNPYIPMIVHLVVGWLQDRLAFEHESASLTSEIVHSYEELHLLYELSQSLNRVLNVESACRLIIHAVLDPLSAEQATIMLYLTPTEKHVFATEEPRRVNLTAGAEARAEVFLDINGELLGVLIVQGKREGLEFSSDNLKLLDAVAALAAPALHNARLYEQARSQADTDPLTGVDNHRRLQQRIDEEIERAKRYQHPFSVIMIDLNNFKLFNDVYGHPVGDRALQTVANCMRQSIRSTDAVGRYGGDEFMLILVETDNKAAQITAERLLEAVKTADLIVDDQHLPLSLSIGIATYPDDALTKNQLIACADANMYEAKHSGSTQVHHSNMQRTDWLNLSGSNFGVLEGLVKSVDIKDHYTRKHSEVVTEAALMLAVMLNLSDETLRALRIAGLLHDVGKIGIPDTILKKPGRLTPEEYEVMKQHVQLSEMIIKGVPHLNDVLDAVAHHHERYDGTGYPYGKQQDQIPLLGRILAIADAYSAMYIDRPYRKGKTWQEIRAELEHSAGSQFDPHLVPIFIAAIEARHNAL